jgi:hypothetical protein
MPAVMAEPIGPAARNAFFTYPRIRSLSAGASR